MPIFALSFVRVDDARLARKGVAIAGAANDQDCLDGMDSWSHADRPRGDVTLTRHRLGFESEPRNFVIATILPRS